MNVNSKLIVGVLVIGLGSGLAYTQLAKGTQMKMDHSAMTASSTSESSKAYETAMAGMMKAMSMPMSGKPDLDFVQGMMPHHQGAIDMAKAVLQYGKDPEVKTLAEGVIKAQESEIAFMKDWLAKADKAMLPTMAEATKPSEEAMAAMMKNMMIPYTGDADVDFMKSMVPHHQGAIDMAKVALQFAKDPALLKLANDIVAAQESEIGIMKDWLKRHGQ